MSHITLTLHKKTLRLSMYGGTYSQKLSFEAMFPKLERLTTHDGVDIRTGSVVFTLEGGGHEPEISYIEAFEDIDSNHLNLPSINFYAEVTPEVFTLIRDSSLDSVLVLRIVTNLMGAIQFNSPLGEEKVWDTSQQNPVPVEGFDVDISQATTEPSHTLT